MSAIAERQPWTYDQVQELIALAHERVPAALICLRMRRSPADVHEKLSQLGLSAPPDA